MKRVSLYIAVTCSFIAITAFPATADLGSPREPPSLLNTISLWLSDNFDLPPSEMNPHLATLPGAELVRMRYGPDSGIPPGQVVAAYDPDTSTIYLSEHWTGDTPEELSALVHEMVHHMQASADQIFACPNEREQLAYRAQDAWLSLFGETLESAFDIDPAALLFGTVCTY